MGENGSGKPTLLEALAWAVGFNAQGGNRSVEHSYSSAISLWDGSTVNDDFETANQFVDQQRLRHVGGPPKSLPKK